MPRRSLVVSLVLAVALVVGAHAAARDDTRGAQASATAKTIASTTTSDFRVVVTAKRRGGGAMPSAALTATTFARAQSGWRRAGTHDLGDSYFWKTVTGPRVLCRLDLRTAGPGTAFKPRAIVQMLVTPSIGCGPVERIPVG